MDECGFFLNKNSMVSHTVNFPSMYGRIFANKLVDGKTNRTFGLNWIVSKLIKYSNFNHSCPYDGYNMFACLQKLIASITINEHFCY